MARAFRDDLVGRLGQPPPPAVQCLEEDFAHPASEPSAGHSDDERARAAVRRAAHRVLAVPDASGERPVLEPM